MKVLGLIMGMTLVTYFPRLLPFLIISGRPVPAYWQRFLKLLPFAALGALILPGALQALPGRPEVASAGIICAALCAWFGGGIILSIATALAAVLVGLWIG